RRRDKKRAGRWQKRPFPVTDLGREILPLILPHVAEYMASDAAPPLYQWLEPHVLKLTPHELALVALAPLMEQIDRGWDWDDPSAFMKICLAIGRALRDKVEVKNLFTFDSPLTEDLFDGAKKAWEALKTEPNKHLVVWKYRKLREELGFPSP